MSSYRNPKILPRRKGQRYDGNAFGDCIAQLDETAAGRSIRGVPGNCTIEQVGETMGYQGYGIDKKPMFLFEVTKPNGDVVPCYSFTAGTGRDGYMICQDYSHKIAKA